LDKSAISFTLWESFSALFLKLLYVSPYTFVLRLETRYIRIKIVNTACSWQMVLHLLKFSFLPLGSYIPVSISMFKLFKCSCISLIFLPLVCSLNISALGYTAGTTSLTKMQIFEKALR
jgi:hypothetical protein